MSTKQRQVSYKFAQDAEVFTAEKSFKKAGFTEESVDDEKNVLVRNGTN